MENRRTQSYSASHKNYQHLIWFCLCGCVHLLDYCEKCEKFCLRYEITAPKILTKGSSFFKLPNKCFNKDKCIYTINTTNNTNHTSASRIKPESHCSSQFQVDVRRRSHVSRKQPVQYACWRRLVTVYRFPVLDGCCITRYCLQTAKIN